MAAPKKGVAYDFYDGVLSVGNSGTFQNNPTIATGDFKISKDDGAFTNLATLPAVTPAGSSTIKFSLSATEMNADKIAIQGIDAAGDEWTEFKAFIDNTVSNIDDLSLASALSTAQSDLDKLTGTDGATLATSQPNYAPNVVVPDAAGVAPTVAEITADIDANSTQLTQIASDVVGLAGAAMRGTDNAATAAALATMQTAVTAIKAKTDQMVYTVANQLDSNALSVSGTAQTAGDLAALITTIDTVVDAIKVVTDKFVFTVANQVDSNVQSINDVTITGDGSGTPFNV